MGKEAKEIVLFYMIRDGENLQNIGYPSVSFVYLRDRRGTVNHISLQRPLPLFILAHLLHMIRALMAIRRYQYSMRRECKCPS